MLSKRSNWTEGKFSQARAQQSSQVDCNIKLTHPTRTIQKLAEDLFGEKWNHLPLFSRKVLDTYSVIEILCNKTILQKCYHFEYVPIFSFLLASKTVSRNHSVESWNFKIQTLYSFSGNMIQAQKEVLSKRSNWTGWKASQACAQQPSQVDCNIRLTHPTRTIQKLTEDLSEGKSKPSSTFFS